MATKRKTAADKLAAAHHQQLLDAIAGMTDEMVECRDIKHSYRKWSTRWLAKEREYERQLKCLRCGTIRVQRVSERGYLLAGTYEYAEGYLVKGLGRLDVDDRGAMRLASIQNDLQGEHSNAG